MLKACHAKLVSLSWHAFLLEKKTYSCYDNKERFSLVH